MHCTDAACIKVCPTEALYHTEFGSVSHARPQMHRLQGLHPGLPVRGAEVQCGNQQDHQVRSLLHRLQANQPPACVLSCPTGAITIGDRDAMLKKAYKRAKELGGDASVYGDKFVDGTHVVYVLTEKPDVYEHLPVDPKMPLTIIVWKDILKPAGLITAGAVVAGAFLHYITHGPKTPGRGNHR